MTTVEVLTARPRVRRSVIGVSDRPQDQIDLVCEVGPSERQM
jgi:hypothetical protein